MHPASAVDIDHLRFFIPEEGESLLANGLPDAAAEEPSLPLPELSRRLLPPANDQLHHVLVIGWQAGAVAAIAADSVLRMKRLVWAVRPEHLAFLARDLATDAGRDLSVHVATCSDQAQLPYLMERMPRTWTMALLDQSLCSAPDLQLLGQTRFQRTRNSSRRLLHDLQHLLAREQRLGESIPLGAWKNAYSGRTALCLAAGPSLDRRLDFIREHQDRCVVIAVDVLQARLQEEGIAVDFVVNVDSHDILAEKLVDQVDPHTTMIMPLRGHRDIDRRFHQVSYFDHSPLAHPLIGTPCSFSTGTSVGIASVGFADFLGCNEVVLLGHDLSWSAECYYSSMVSDRDRHTGFVRAKAEKMKRQVPGNGGETVITDYLFEVAIQDMGMFLTGARSRLTAYNLNVNDSIGARILHTSALPDDWRPLAADTPCPRPSSDRRVADTCATIESAGTLISRACHFLAETWTRLRSEGLSSVIIEQRIMRDIRCLVGYSLLRPFIEGDLLHLTCIRALPPSISTSEHEQAAEAHLAATFEAANAIIDAVCVGETIDLPLDPPADRCEQLRPLLAFVNRSCAGLAPDILGAVYTPAKASAHRELCAALPDLGLPTPLSLLDAIEYLRRVGGWLDDAFISRLLCLAALEGFEEVVATARRHQVVPDQFIPDSDRENAHPEAPQWVTSTERLLRVRSGSSRQIRRDLKSAAAWHPCRPHIMRCLADDRAAVTDSVRRLVKARELPLDDQSMALLVLHMRDFPLACHLVHPFTDQIGEATVMAVCQRQIELGEHSKATATLSDIRLLSRFKDQALHLLASLAKDHGNLDQAESCASAISDGELRGQWESILACARGRGRELVACWNDRPGVVHPQVLAATAERLISASDIDALGDLFTYLLAHSRGFGPFYRQAFELSRSLQTVLEQLGCDVGARMRAAKEQMESAATSAA